MCNWYINGLCSVHAIVDSLLYAEILCIYLFVHSFIHSFITHSSYWSSPLFPITSVPLRPFYFHWARGHLCDGTWQYFVKRQKSNAGTCFFTFMISLLLCTRLWRPALFNKLKWRIVERAVRCASYESTRVSIPNILIKFVRGVQNLSWLSIVVCSVELTESVALILFGFVLSTIVFRVTKKIEFCCHLFRLSLQ